MKRYLPLLLAMLFATSCSDLIEKKLDIYEDAIEELEDVDDFLSLMDETIATEKAVARAVAKMQEKDWEELKEEYGSEYELMLDSVEKVRESYFRAADKIFLSYPYNFVERRTLLYRKAADNYCIAKHIEELDAIKKLIKRYSALSFVDGQRSCDPPAKIREEYEAAKELAENCYNVAKTRIEEGEAEN